jgi:tripartite-type tricarboxylate transporter receptor subunit TctC
MKRALRALAVSAFILVPAATASAQSGDYPNRPVRMINPYAPGGAVDVIARTFSQKLNEAIGQSVVVDNRPGAGTNIGTEMVVRAAADGYTILLTSAVIATNVSLYKLSFDPIRDLAPVSQPLQSPFVVMINPSVPAKNMQEFLALARSRGNELTLGSAGAGTTTHLMFELLKAMGKFNMVHVPYKGGAPALNAVIGGEVQMSILPVTIVMPQAKAGRVRALAVTSAKRVEQLPELPTVAESGIPGYDPIGWYAVFAPAGTPRAVIMRLNTEINRILQQADVKERFIANGMFPVIGPPEALRDHLKSEISRWSAVIKSTGIQPD